MDIKLNITKSVEENASEYFNKAKKLKKKLIGAQRTIEETKQKLEKALKEEKTKEEKSNIPKRKKHWFEKFRWFYSSEGFLCIGGRDATTNEIIIKKHTAPEDLVFHTDMAGSPFFVIKTDGKEPTEKTLREVADGTITFSRAWKLGLIAGDVFYVKPEQITKEAQSGEYLSKGSFMIKGKTNYVENRINLAIGLYNDMLMAGPVEAVKANCKHYITLNQGSKR